MPPKNCLLQGCKNLGVLKSPTWWVLGFHVFGFFGVKPAFVKRSNLMGVGIYTGF